METETKPADPARRALLTAGVAVFSLALLASCGKKNAPKPPGPNPSYPKSYPSS